MTHSEFNLEEHEIPAGQVRVTATELAEAAAAVETRKAREAHRQAETIPLEEAIHHLGLNATPEELLAEVEMRRRATVRTVAAQREKRRRRAVIALSVCLPISVVLALLLCIQTLPIGSPSVAEPATTETPAAAPTVPTSTGERLSDVEQGTPVYASLSQIYDLAHGKPAGLINVADEPIHQANGAQWKILKLHGETYVLGRYTSFHVPGYNFAADDPAGDMSGGPADERAIPLSVFKNFNGTPHTFGDTEIILLPENYLK